MNTCIDTSINTYIHNAYIYTCIDTYIHADIHAYILTFTHTNEEKSKVILM